MNPLSEFLKSKRAYHSRGIQKALRHIDPHILALSLINIDKNEREILYRNTTKRVVNMIEKEMEIISLILKNDDSGIDEISKLSIIEAQEIITEMLIKFSHEKSNEPVVYPEELPDVKLDSFEDILKTFANINDHARKYGLFSINGIENKTDHILFQKGIGLIVDGTDPLILEEIMENYIRSLSSKYLRELNMISTAIKSIQMGLLSVTMIDKLKSLENS
jgi:hypothetical protein